jgi:site-specific recombinase XerD
VAFTKARAWVLDVMFVLGRQYQDQLCPTAMCAGDGPVVRQVVEVPARRRSTRGRTLELPALCVEVLRAHRVAQLQVRVAAGERWIGLDLVFSTALGSPLDAANVRRAFRRVAEAAGLDAKVWTPRELLHSFRFAAIQHRLAIEDISHLVGHANTRVTESGYRKELRPV